MSHAVLSREGREGVCGGLVGFSLCPSSRFAASAGWLGGAQVRRSPYADYAERVGPQALGGAIN